MIDSLPKLELYNPTPIQQWIEQNVTNGVGINPHYHSEQSVLAAQTVLGEMELRQGRKEVEEAVKSMQSMLESNSLVRRGFTAGGIHVYTEYDDPEALAILVNGVVGLKKSNTFRLELPSNPFIIRFSEKEITSKKEPYLHKYIQNPNRI